MRRARSARAPPCSARTGKCRSAETMALACSAPAVGSSPSLCTRGCAIARAAGRRRRRFRSERERRRKPRCCDSGERRRVRVFFGADGGRCCARCLRERISAARRARAALAKRRRQTGLTSRSSRSVDRTDVTRHGHGRRRGIQKAYPPTDQPGSRGTHAVACQCVRRCRSAAPDASVRWRRARSRLHTVRGVR